MFFVVGIGAEWEYYSHTSGPTAATPTGPVSVVVVVVVVTIVGVLTEREHYMLFIVVRSLLHQRGPQWEY